MAKTCRCLCHPLECHAHAHGVCTSVVKSFDSTLSCPHNRFVLTKAEREAERERHEAEILCQGNLSHHTPSLNSEFNASSWDTYWHNLVWLTPLGDIIIPSFPRGHERINAHRNHRTKDTSELAWESFRRFRSHLNSYRNIANRVTTNLILNRLFFSKWEKFFLRVGYRFQQDQHIRYGFNHLFIRVHCVSS